ncbi:chromatin associated protein KTI12 [Apodospora peruviana]|uniref:Chromatin associated protein KTI12 n=1 Tax=Apodospora peruviana TaxID=516989 RepID=A0AAE0HXJ3_9PEZI|nr:chromatin associated protein KTI12 [Apodospora peruviana]
MRTPSAVLQIGCSVDRARGVNEARLARRQEAATKRQQQQQKEDTAETKPTSDASNNNNQSIEGEKDYDDDKEEPYSPENWNNLVFRYEEPNQMTRWDSPLFTLIWEDDETQTRETFDKIWDVIAGEAKKIIRPNQSTIQRDKDPGGDYLYVLERETQDIVKRILSGQSDDGGDEVYIPRNPGEKDSEEYLIELPAGKKVGLAQLQRYRRAFVALNRGGIGLEALGKLAAGRLRESFVGYLNDALEKDG